MSDFIKYHHVERFGRPEVAGIEDGVCHVFPKLDGTNASVWWEDEGIRAGSRRRPLTPMDDNHGFCDWAYHNDKLIYFLEAYKHLRLYGEWLVPHTFKGYRDDAWRRFYVFDVVERNTNEFVAYDEYSQLLEQYDLDFIPRIAIVNHGQEKQFWDIAEQNDYLCKPGAGPGEGIVIKRHGFTNRYGRTVWAKMVRSEFKEQNLKTMGCPVVSGAERVEDKIIAAAVTPTLVQKELAKIQWLDGPVQPRLLQSVYRCVVTEELWPAIKKLKNPTIDFKLLNRLCVGRVKELASDLF